MKKLFFIFLLTILPLQFSWSAVAVYCQHEKEQSTHFGHHTHEHKDKVAVKADETPEGPKKLVVDGDCAISAFIPDCTAYPGSAFQRDA